MENKITCTICINPDLIFTCYCYKCKKTFPTGKTCVITCPDDPECENAEEILYGQWTRTTYYCNKCDANHLFYDGYLRYHFIEKCGEPRFPRTPPPLTNIIEECGEPITPPLTEIIEECGEPTPPPLTDLNIPDTENDTSTDETNKNS